MTDYSKNDDAERVMGRRPEGIMPFDQPCELGYHCPVCKYRLMVKGNYDERLHWSEYNGFIWCEVCNRDYPSVLCMPLKTPEQVEEATKIFLLSVESAIKRKTEPPKLGLPDEVIK